MRQKRAGLWIVPAILIIAVGAWAQTKKNGKQIEDKVRQAGFGYYVGTLFGDADQYLKVTRMPIYVVRDGVGNYRDEKETRALLAKIAEKTKAANRSEEDRQRLIGSMIAIFDEASIQFVGANTATLTFLIRPAQKEGDGDSLGTLVLHRKEDRWQVIAEVTDSAPVPPEYLK